MGENRFEERTIHDFGVQPSINGLVKCVTAIYCVESKDLSHSLTPCAYAFLLFKMKTSKGMNDQTQLSLEMVSLDIE